MMIEFYLGAILQVLCNAVGGGRGGQISLKKHYEGVGGCRITRKKPVA